MVKLPCSSYSILKRFCRLLGFVTLGILVHSTSARVGLSLSSPQLRQCSCANVREGMFVKGTFSKERSRGNVCEKTLVKGDGGEKVCQTTFTTGDGGENVRERTFAKGDGATRFAR